MRFWYNFAIAAICWYHLVLPGMQRSYSYYYRLLAQLSSLYSQLYSAQSFIPVNFCHDFWVCNVCQLLAKHNPQHFSGIYITYHVSQCLHRPRPPSTRGARCTAAAGTGQASCWGKFDMLQFFSFPFFWYGKLECLIFQSDPALNAWWFCTCCAHETVCRK